MLNEARRGSSRYGTPEEKSQMEWEVVRARGTEDRLSRGLGQVVPVNQPATPTDASTAKAKILKEEGARARKLKTKGGRGRYPASMSKGGRGMCPASSPKGGRGRCPASSPKGGRGRCPASSL